jgi:hypothetical protein
MARLKLSALVNQINGSVNGSTFQQGISGQIMRNKPMPVNPRTKYQSWQRNYLMLTLNKWQYLSDAEKTAWNTFATYFNKTQKNNTTRILSGQAVFTYINNIRLIHGLAFLTAPVYNAGRLVPLTYNFFTETNQIAVDLSRAMISANEFLHISVTPPVSLGLMKAPNKFRTVIITDNETDEIYFTAEYQEVFNVLPGNSSKVFFKVVQIDQESGITYANSFGQCEIH